MRILTEPDQDYVTALEAYRRLDFLPGYGDLADQLFTDYLAAKSRDARNLREVQGFSDRLAEMPGREALGESLLGEFWDRRTMESMHRGDRDEALLYSLRALNSPTDERRRVVSELYGIDYANLLGDDPDARAADYPRGRSHFGPGDGAGRRDIAWTCGPWRRPGRAEFSASSWSRRRLFRCSGGWCSAATPVAAISNSSC